ncbi:hypothetical protein [Mesorhizobium sp. M0768]|uniref:hypothetical protein n=1 Tax=Mesorhizobium sp. M0768 TaxID=2956996 RepID=UPI00333DADC1
MRASRRFFLSGISALAGAMAALPLYSRWTRQSGSCWGGSPATGTLRQGGAPVYATVASMSALSVPVGVNTLRVDGFSAAGDGGGALYKKVLSEPSHAAKFQTDDGAWWELAEGQDSSADMLGAVGDGITDDDAAVQTAIALRSATSKRYLVETVNSFSNAEMFERVIDSGAVTPVINIADNTEFWKLSGRVESIDGQGIRANSHGSGKIVINGADVIGASYGFVSDDAESTDLRDVIISASFMYSDRADVIALNHFDGNAQNFILIGDILGTGVGSTFAGSGFGLSVAGTKGWLFADSIIKFTRSEAIHIEDEQREGQISNVTVRETIDHGLYISRSAESKGQGPSDGINVSNFVVKHNKDHPNHPTGSNTGFYGIYVLATEHGSAPACNFSNVRVHGFEYGFNIGGGSANEVCNIRNGYAKDCDFAANLAYGAIVCGDILATDCHTLIRSGNNCEIESIVTNSVPRSVLQYVGTVMNHGVIIRHLQFPIIFNHAGNGTEIFDLMDMPTRLLARVSVRLNNNNNCFYKCLNLAFDGENFSTDSDVSSYIGDFSDATFLNNSGKLALRATSTSVVSEKRLIVDIRGDIYSTKDLMVY